MAANRIADMTLEELTQLIDQRIQQVVLHREAKQSMREVNASIRRNRIVLPAGAKSALEMLREDRDT